MSMIRFLTLVPVVLVLVLAGCRQSTTEVDVADDGELLLGRESATATEERAVALGDRRLEIDLPAGTVTLVGSDDQEARIRFERIARGATASSAQERLERVTVTESGTAETFRFEGTSGRGDGITINASGTVPFGAEVRVNLGAGTVHISNVGGPIVVESGAGNIEVAGLDAAPVRLRTGAGNIRAGFAMPLDAGEVDLRTSAGDLTLYLPETSSTRIDLATTVGTIRIPDLQFTQPRLRRQGVGARFDGRLGNGAANVRAETTAGTISLESGSMERLEGIQVPTTVPDTRPDTTGAPGSDSVDQP